MNKEQISALINDGKYNAAIVRFADNYKIPASELDGFIQKILSRETEYAYKDLKEYESFSGYKMNFAFETGWNMARIKAKNFN